MHLAETSTLRLTKQVPRRQVISFECSKFYALAFVPVSDVVTAFKLVADRLEDDDQTDDLIGYFEKTWIG
jgi:hypothetical protein